MKIVLIVSRIVSDVGLIDRKFGCPILSIVSRDTWKKNTGITPKRIRFPPFRKIEVFFLQNQILFSTSRKKKTENGNPATYHYLRVYQFSIFSAKHTTKSLPIFPPKEKFLILKKIERFCSILSKNF